MMASCAMTAPAETQHKDSAGVPLDHLDRSSRATGSRATTPSPRVTGARRVAVIPPVYGSGDFAYRGRTRRSEAS